MLRHLTPKVGPGSCFLDWELQQESGCTICPTEAVSHVPEGHGYQTQDVPDQKEGPSSL